jgi:hypothetical protein
MSKYSLSTRHIRCGPYIPVYPSYPLWALYPCLPVISAVGPISLSTRHIRCGPYIPVYPSYLLWALYPDNVNGVIYRRNQFVRTVQQVVRIWSAVESIAPVKGICNFSRIQFILKSEV